MRQFTLKSGKPQFYRWLLLIFGALLLYFIPAVILQIAYGPSYGMLSFDNHWVPDGNGGWQAEGFPGTFRPSQPSVNVPVFLRLIPVILPILLILLLFLNPLSRYVDREPNYKATKYKPEECYPEFVEEMPETADEDKTGS